MYKTIRVESGQTQKPGTPSESPIWKGQNHLLSIQGGHYWEIGSETTELQINDLMRSNGNNKWDSIHCKIFTDLNH